MMDLKKSDVVSGTTRSIIQEHGRLFRMKITSVISRSAPPFQRAPSALSQRRRLPSILTYNFHLLAPSLAHSTLHRRVEQGTRGELCVDKEMISPSHLPC